MIKPKTIPELFAKRQKAFLKTTEEILAMIPEALQAIHEYMDIEDFEKQGGVIKWDDLTLIPHGDEQVVVLAGFAGYPVGAEVEMDTGDKVKVTEDTAPYFRRIVRVGLPVSVVTLSKAEVIEHFKKVEAEEIAKEQEFIKDLDTALGFSEHEFDLAQLTPAQRLAYETSFAKPGKA